MISKPDSAIKEYSIAISQNPDLYDPYLNRGRLLHQMKKCNEAMNDFAAAILLMPERPEAYYARSYCYTEQGNRSLALQDVEKAISLGFAGVDNQYYQSLKSR
jgi:tetratricopeptide (TPR) repeat protein